VKTPADLVTAVDRRTGALVSDAIVAHHRRRLAKSGHASSLDTEGAGWAVDGWEPRPDCLLEVLIDGAEALPRIARELREARSPL
jgi:hypothetical protein